MSSTSETATSGDGAEATVGRSYRPLSEVAVLIGLLVQQRWLLPLSDASAFFASYLVVLAGLFGLCGAQRATRLVVAAMVAILLNWLSPQPAITFQFLILFLMIVLAANDRASRALVVSLVLMLIIVVVEYVLPLSVDWLRVVGGAVAAVPAVLIDSPENVGATFFGLIPAIVLCVYLSAIFVRQSILSGLPVAAVILLVWMFASGFLLNEIADIKGWIDGWIPLMASAGHHHHHQDASLMGLVPLLLVFVCVAFVAGFGRWLPTDRQADESHSSSMSRGLMAGVVGLLAAVVPLSDYWWESDDRGEVLLYERGMLDWRVPQAEKYFGVGRSGMFGVFEQRLIDWGYDIRKSNRLEELPPAENGIVVLINPLEVLEADAVRLEEFVAAGGGLLVLGDHTDLEGTAEHLDRALSFAGASFRFDSAFPIRRKWRNVYRSTSHPLGVGLGTSNERFQHSTGASLELTGLAWRPLVYGQRVFSDLGNRLNVEDAYLGDYAYQFGEGLGDLVVAAARPYGRGRVVVFGDTSAFQNLGITRSVSMVRDVLRYAGSGGSGLIAYAPFAVIAFVGVAVWVVRLRLWVWSVFAIAFAAGVFACESVTQPMDDDPGIVDGGRLVAAVDFTHQNAFLLEHFQVRSSDGLFNSLLRNGYYPDAVVEAESLSDVAADLYFLIAPLRSYSENEVNSLLRRVRDGASLVVSVGFEEADGCENLFERIGVDVWHEPLGAVPIAPRMRDPQEFAAFRQTPHFAEAWPLRFEDDLGWQPFYEWRGHVIVGARKWGDGRILVIGDSRFLLDETLETEKDYWPGNIKFFRAMLMTWPVDAEEADAVPPAM